MIHSNTQDRITLGLHRIDAGRHCTGCKQDFGQPALVRFTINVMLPLTPIKVTLPLTPIKVTLPLTPINVTLPLTPINVTLPLTPINVTLPLTPINVTLPLTPINVTLPLIPINVMLQLIPQFYNCRFIYFIISIFLNIPILDAVLPRLICWCLYCFLFESP
jgi:hypothetical protein